MRLPSHFQCQSEVVVPQGTHNFCPTWLQIRASHDILPLEFDYLLEELTELGNIYSCQFIEEYAKEYR